MLLSDSCKIKAHFDIHLESYSGTESTSLCRLTMLTRLAVHRSQQNLLRKNHRLVFHSDLSWNSLLLMLKIKLWKVQVLKWKLTWSLENKINLIHLKFLEFLNWVKEKLLPYCLVTWVWKLSPCQHRYVGNKVTSNSSPWWWRLGAKKCFHINRRQIELNSMQHVECLHQQTIRGVDEWGRQCASHACVLHKKHVFLITAQILLSFRSNFPQFSQLLCCR